VTYLYILATTWSGAESCYGGNNREKYGEEARDADVFSVMVQYKRADNSASMSEQPHLAFVSRSPKNRTLARGNNQKLCKHKSS
jgi:hypothetical protein